MNCQPLSVMIVWDSITAYDVLLHKLLNLLSCNRGQWLGFYPLCKVVDADNDELHLSFPWREGSQDVHSPLGEWP